MVESETENRWRIRRFYLQNRFGFCPKSLGFHLLSTWRSSSSSSKMGSWLCRDFLEQTLSDMVWLWWWVKMVGEILLHQLCCLSLDFTSINSLLFSPGCVFTYRKIHCPKGIDDWWRNELFWVIGGASSHLFALFQGLLKVLAGVNTNFTVTSKVVDDGALSELYIFKWTTLLIPPTTLLIINIIGVIVKVSYAISNGYDSWGPLFGRLFFAHWVIVFIYTLSLKVCLANKIKFLPSLWFGLFFLLRS